MSEPLLVVDVQAGFINQFTHHIPERVARLIGGGEYAPVLFTRLRVRAGWAILSLSGRVWTVRHAR